ncbi:PRD domain-containing protein [Enterococcus sp. LJL99]
MKVIKKINNNVAECLDDNGNYLIAFGKGIGFPKTPYELTDLTKVTMTFYKLNEHFESLLREIPEEILNLSAEIVTMAQKELNGQLNPTLVFSLADHIHFSIQRLTKYKNVRMTFSYEIEQLYPKESLLAKQAIKMIQEQLHLVLPKGEITSITMHFVDSQSEYKISQEELLVEEVIESATNLIEEELKIQVDRQEFNYNRFCMHMFYYLKRLKNGEEFIDQGSELLQTFKQQHQDIYVLTQHVATLIQQIFGIMPKDGELFYLMIHIHRLYEKNGRSKKNE